MQAPPNIAPSVTGKVKFNLFIFLSARATLSIIGRNIAITAVFDKKVESTAEVNPATRINILSFLLDKEVTF